MHNSLNARSVFIAIFFPLVTSPYCTMSCHDCLIQAVFGFTHCEVYHREIAAETVRFCSLNKAIVTTAR